MILYFVLPQKMRNLLILISGLFFYAWGEPKYVIIMILSTAIDYTAGRLIDKFDSCPKKRTVFLLVSVIMNIGLLAVFKYSSFIITTINSIFGTSIPDPQLPLPIGISFYTFQSMSYTIDLYMRNIKVQKNFISFTAYVTLFPQIVAGPIVRYEDVAAELDTRTVTVSKVGEGIGKFLKGLAKKVLLANNIGLIWTQVKAMDYGEISAATAWLGILAF
ncbi:MAG: MBOAT family protein, partial [Oscillospiraceae bacterium]